MPSYADEIAARHPGLQRGATSGPVRLTISRGDSYRAPNGQITFAERWEEEEIMDIGSIDAEIDSWQTNLQQDQANFLVNTIRERRLGKGNNGTHLKGFSLLVLDTNVLLSTLDFLKTLVSQCLSRNIFALSNAAFPPSPIAIVIPHIVLSELDNLKTSGKGNAAPMARAANAWLLSVLQSQKREMYDLVVEGVSRRDNIPKNSWALHVEDTGHASKFGDNFSLLSPDEQIVKICRSLKEETRCEVFFCSEDVNAKMRAESEDISSLSLVDLVKCVGGDREELVKLAGDLIEQWQDQAFNTAEEEETMERMEEDGESIEAGAGGGGSAIQYQYNDSIDHHNSIQNNYIQQAQTKTAITGRTTQHSLYAHHSPSASTNKSSNTYQAIRRHSTTSTQQNRIHHYPKDRSTASSMWAV
jgi:hypothetical protein